jgi:RNA polymerase sigma-70 factor (sigma-E family)
MSLRPSTSLRGPAIPIVRRSATGATAEALTAPRAGVDLRDLEREATITRLFDAEHIQLERLATLMGADGDAEDVVAEAFCELHRRWRKLRDPAAALPYLRSVVCNLSRMRLRHLKVVHGHREPPPGDADSAEVEALLREDQREVVSALRRLPFRQRQALVLRYWLDLREVDVADAMGITPGAVKAHTFRALQTLERHLEARR